ncbi:MAG: gfo/Idh/MocA family oxidoreductase, partial [Planctomycetaceae bacterium]
NEASFDVDNQNFVAEGCIFNMDKHLSVRSVSAYSNNHKNAQETALFRNFSELVNSGKRDPFWGQAALQTQQVLDAALRSATSGSGPVNPLE